MKLAIVIGGSIAGLLAAQVLSTHFERVTIIERDEPAEKPEPRKGAPQGRHIHALLARGARILERMFPGLQDELGAAGAPLVDWLNDSIVSSQYGRLPRFESDLRSRACSRPLLEWTIRQRVLKNSRVHFLTGTDAVDLVGDDTCTRVHGVQVRRRGTGAISTLHADLAVDASGRSSRAQEWLAAMGVPAPPEQVVNSALAYASRMVRMPEHFKPDFKLLIQRIRPPLGKRGGGMYLIEGNAWLVTLGGAKNEQPPLDEAGFLQYAQRLNPNDASPGATGDAPLLHELLALAQPLTPIVGYQRTENRWRHYEKLKRMPDGFVLVGDAVCGFNPVYGQGMSVAAMGAEQLGAWLADGGYARAGGALNVQKRLAAMLRTPWLLATGDDARAVGMDGRSPVTRMNHAYVDALMGLTTSNQRVCKAFLDVAHLVRSPRTLFAPGIFAQVLLHALRTRTAGRNEGSARAPVGKPVVIG